MPTPREKLLALLSPEFHRDLDLGDLLGEGGMGWVFRARQQALNRDVVVKFLKAGSVSDRARFIRVDDLRRSHVEDVNDGAPNPGRATLGMICT